MKRRPLFFLITFLLGSMLLAGLATPAPAGTFDQTDYDRWVVRAYYDDPSQIASIATWTAPWEVNREQGYILVETTAIERQFLIGSGFQIEIDSQLTAELHRTRVPLPGQGDDTIPGFPCYSTVEGTFARAQLMAATYPDLVQWIDVGDSWEKVTPGGNDGYDLMVLVLTNQNIPGPKPVLFATTAIHAREYATAELSTRFAEGLLAGYGIDADSTWLIDHHEIHLMLHANPDGRKQAETGLSWRKNTNQNYCSPTSNSRGADLNRNFEFQWGCCGGSSGNECSLTYRGPNPASEPETQVIQAYGQSVFPDQRDDPLGDPAPEDATGVYLDIHAFSELVLWPWGFTNNQTGNGTAYQTLGRKLAFYNDYFPVQSIGLYPTDGTTIDFFYGDLGVAGFVYELGTAFFQSCSVFENEILPDNLPSLLYAAKAARTPYMTPAGPEAFDLAVSESLVTAGTPVDLTATVDDSRYNNSNGSEPVQPILTAEYYVDIPPWDGGTPIPMVASDGTFNMFNEDIEATIDTTGLPAGRHIIYVRGQDVAMNWGAFSAIFLDIAEPIEQPTALFTASATTVLVGETVDFTNLSTGGDLTYEWDFGDGSPLSTDTNPSHSYTTPDTYTVMLTATNSVGSDSYSLDITVEQPIEPPTALFTSSATTVLVDEIVDFTNLSTGDDLSYTWDFGDGSPTSTDTNPSHSYTAPGTYTVMLTAINSVGSDSYSLDITVELPKEPPTALFSAIVTIVWFDTTVNFINLSTGENVTYEWDFGDGSPISNDINPSHSYAAPGTYTVMLTATNSAGSDSYSLDITIESFLFFPISVSP